MKLFGKSYSQLIMKRFKIIIFHIIFLCCRAGEDQKPNMLLNELAGEFAFNFKNGSYIKRDKSLNKLKFHFSDGKFFLLDDDQDFRHLLEKSNEHNIDCPQKWCFNEGDGLSVFLDKNLKNYYSYYKKIYMSGGNPRAKNSYGSGQFNYQLINQTQSEGYAIEAERIWKEQGKKDVNDLPHKAQKHWAGGSVRGMECQGSALTHQMKSLGIIRPDLNREEFEERHTNLHPTGDKKQGNTKIPTKYNSGLRFRKPVFTQDEILEIAGILKNSDWGKLTGTYEKKIDNKEYY